MRAFAIPDRDFDVCIRIPTTEEIDRDWIDVWCTSKHAVFWLLFCRTRNTYAMRNAIAGEVIEIRLR